MSPSSSSRRRRRRRRRCRRNGSAGAGLYNKRICVPGSYPVSTKYRHAAAALCYASHGTPALFWVK